MRIAIVCLLFGAPILLAQLPAPNVTGDDLLAGLKNPSSWLTYSGDYTGRRHSPLTQITPENVRRLAAQWTFQSETLAPGRGFEATPILIDGILYLTGSNNFAWRLTRERADRSGAIVASCLRI